MLEACAGDVVILDFARALDGVAGEVMRVPDDALGGDFRVLPEELEGVDAGGGVVFLIGELGGLDGRLLALAQTPVDDGERVVGGEVVGVDGLKLFVGIAGVGVIVGLEVTEAELAESIFGAGIFGEHGLEVGDGFAVVAGVALDEGAVVEGARVAGEQGEGLGEVGAGVGVALPGDFNDSHVGVGVGVVGAEGSDALEGVDGVLVLLGVEQSDAVVVPAHPLGVFIGAGLDGRVGTDVEGAGLGSDVDDGLGIVLLVKDVVDEVLVEAAVLNGGSDGDAAGDVFGQTEAVTDKLGAAGLDGVVVGEDAVVPDLVNVVEFALFVDEAVGEGVRRGIEVAVGLQEAAFGEGLAGAVLHGEVDPGLVEVALLGDEGVADAFVLDDDVSDERGAGREGEAGEAEGGDEDLIFGRGLGGFVFEGEEVDVEDAFAVGAVLEEVDEFLCLFVVMVVGRHEGVAADPAVVHELAVFGAGL